MVVRQGRNIIKDDGNINVIQQSIQQSRIIMRVFIDIQQNHIRGSVIELAKKLLAQRLIDNNFEADPLHHIL